MIICEGIMFIAGLIALVAGKIRMYGKKTLQGGRARLVGIILMAPGPLALLLGTVIGARGGVTQDNITALTALEAGMLVVAIIAAIIIAVTAPQPTAETVKIDYAAAPVEDTSAKLKQLQEMLDKGLITPQDYEVKRSELLSKF